MFALKDENGVLLGEMLQFITFDLLPPNSTGKTLSMALNVQKVKEVVQFNALSPMPEACDSILGIYDLRGCPIPVLSIISLISKDARVPDYGTGHRILICELQNIWVGIPVEKTGRMFTCPSSGFLAPPIGSKTSSKKIITGLVKRDSGYVPVLDLDGLIESIGIEKTPVSENTTSYPNYHGKRILVVDDSKLILKQLGLLFTKMGFSIEFADNGAEGLHKIASATAPFDLIFTDIEMPVLDGIAMARKIRTNAATAQTPIVFNSALSNPALIHDIENEKLGRYIVKFDPSTIIRQLQVLFDEHIPTSAQ